MSAERAMPWKAIAIGLAIALAVVLVFTVLLVSGVMQLAFSLF